MPKIKLKKLKLKKTSKPVHRELVRKPTATSQASKMKLRQVDNVSKVAISIRLDQDVVDYYKEHNPKGYQSAINADLRKIVEAAGEA